MSLLRLPNELLDDVVAHSIPEGFESLALSCKRLYGLCLPFIANHNCLRSRFHSFEYDRFEYKSFEDDSFDYDTRPSTSRFKIFNAHHLIECIAQNPLVARYIRRGNFKKDRFPLGPSRSRDGWYDEKAVFRLLALSPYLKQAELGSITYNSIIRRDSEVAIFSQYAATFLLTLLPNIEELTLPRLWQPCYPTTKLIRTIVDKSKNPHLPYDRPSLAEVTKFDLSCLSQPNPPFVLDDVKVFLSLPKLRRTVLGKNCLAGKYDLENISETGLGERLITIRLIGCFNAADIEGFLLYRPRLKEFRCHHEEGRGRLPCQRFSEYFAAMERALGSHLLVLSLATGPLFTCVNPGRLSLRGYQRLQKLQLSIEYVPGLMIAAADLLHMLTMYRFTVSREQRLFLNPRILSICNIVPASVSQLSLRTRGRDLDAKALEILFSEFVTDKASKLPALEKLQVSWFDNAVQSYQDQYFRLFNEARLVGVKLQHRLEWATEWWHE